ncbi:SusD-like starch-binding protein associating with outer membrane [Lutibacter sp. Hel_I_33_5]|uniref:RagB/SusD family nutrient uptake outer membrane protein n=1 Tax=Lutibacter sp. Hel_I_33_5 TaxID=1566289 RepID=UPI0011A3EBAE|nr:RagB/SusD family nutrient uptake outer membrane protein [Lutibacter sp. Hel_I_33_5]TVZ57219.1 SusD-like starch-binding protein associating with outer membrane [Lutibacter sp. Hel_I_33_5]
MKNKIIYKITVALVVLFTINSCDEYLEITPEGKQNTENYFNVPQDYHDALVGVYDLLNTTALNNMLGEIASDNTLCGGENPTDVLEWQQIDDMIHTPDNGALRSIWQWMYAGISRANYIVEFQDKTQFQGKEQVLAENLFLRSYYYFELVKFFGDVPLYTDGRISIADTQTIEKTPKAEVYSKIEADLNASINKLPWQQNQKGRATRGAALALLGKIYLYQKKYDEAADAFNKVIASGQYQLVSDFTTVFLNNNENSVEAVFEVQYSGTQEGASFECFQCLEGNFAVGFMGPRFKGGNYAPYASGFSFNIPVQELVDAYETGDTRKDATIFDIDAFVAIKTDVTYNRGSEHTGFFNKKYIPYADDNVIPDQNINRSNNYRAIRYADVLLMAAEANLQATVQKNNPQGLLDQVRDRAFGDANHRVNATLENVLNERRLELAGEGHRFFDQVRTGKTSSIPGFTTSKNEVFPIPRIEIELAGNRWDQNNGY